MCIRDSFKAAFEAGAGSVMSAFHELSGIPATANSFLLRQILREEWRWEGVVLSDFNAIQELIAHGVAADLKDAARLSILAGLDMDMMSDAYALHLQELVEEGAVPLAILDQAVRRVLTMKLSLGLFEHPYADMALAERITLREDLSELALEAVSYTHLDVYKRQPSCCAACTPRCCRGGRPTTTSTWP